MDLKEQLNIDNHLPVKFTLLTSDGKPAFKIVGYENVDKLSKEMEYTQIVTTSGFLILTISTLLFALWLFNRFLFVPLGRMIEDMNKIADGKLDLNVNKKGLREFSTFAETFESMANQIKIRTNDLERLLDLDDSAILCFGHDTEAIYFNKSANMLFGYMEDEISDLDMSDLFSEDVVHLMKDSGSDNIVLQHNNLRARLGCIRKDGYVFQGDVVINPLETMSGFGYTIVLNPVVGEKDNKVPQYVASTIEKNEQRMRAVEQSINSILEIASNNPGLISGVGNVEQPVLSGTETNDNKHLLREQIVLVMRSAIVCWEHDIGKAKLALAEESKIWPVYIDKSTPTTRTLDKYLHIDSCPKNPRSQRVIDTAEFVLKQLGGKQTPHQQKLVEVLQSLRQFMSGI
jgi:PAS domain S-box-containing protein